MSTAPSKVEFPPLLPLGRHPFAIESVAELCVDQFPQSPTRQSIMDGLIAVSKRLTEVGIIGELWIDGSFLTQKFDPEDVDVVLFMRSGFSESCTPEQQAVIDWVSSNLHDSHHCHSFVLVRWPEGDPLYWFGEWWYCYWMKLWGFSRADAPKGIAVVELPVAAPVPPEVKNEQTA